MHAVRTSSAQGSGSTGPSARRAGPIAFACP